MLLSPRFIIYLKNNVLIQASQFQIYTPFLLEIILMQKSVWNKETRYRKNATNEKYQFVL